MCALDFNSLFGLKEVKFDVLSVEFLVWVYLPFASLLSINTRLIILSESYTLVAPRFWASALYRHSILYAFTSIACKSDAPWLVIITLNSHSSVNSPWDDLKTFDFEIIWNNQTTESEEDLAIIFQNRKWLKVGGRGYRKSW